MILFAFHLLRSACLLHPVCSITVDVSVFLKRLLIFFCRLGMEKDRKLSSYVHSVPYILIESENQTTSERERAKEN